MGRTKTCSPNFGTKVTVVWPKCRGVRRGCSGLTAGITSRESTAQMTTGSAAAVTISAATVTPAGGRGKTVRPQAVTCSWCGTEVMVPAKGRVPKWCCTSCRHRPWEQQRAAKSGCFAVEVVERIVTVQLPTPPPVPPPVPVPPAASAPTGAAWVPLLTELARQLDTGRIYTRDLNTILPAFDQALQALNRRLPR